MTGKEKKCVVEFILEVLKEGIGKEANEKLKHLCKMMNIYDFQDTFDPPLSHGISKESYDHFKAHLDLEDDKAFERRSNE